VIRGGALVRSASLVAGLFLFALGIVLQLQSELGLSPWDVLNQGVSEQTPLSFGAANIVVALLVLVTAWALGARIGLGTVANAILIGVFIDALLGLEAVDSLAGHGLAARAALLGGGIALVAAGSAFYIGADLGAGPRDSLMLVGARRTGIRLGASVPCSRSAQPWPASLSAARWAWGRSRSRSGSASRSRRPSWCSSDWGLRSRRSRATSTIARDEGPRLCRR
jgi:uncharacterized membrane protein YczE